MLHVTFHVKTLTPLILSGSDQQRVELRAPTFRGLMRYWWRASLGDLVPTGTRTIEKVIQEERAVFGATDAGSPVAVRLQQLLSLPSERPRREGTRRETMTGRDYLLWSILGRRPAIPAQTTFQVTLSVRSHQQFEQKEHTSDVVKSDQDILKCASAAFWLLTHLGGVGSRSRRCAGSLSVVETQGDIEKFGFSFAIPTCVNDLKKQLEDGIQQVRSLHTSLNQTMRDVRFDTLASGSCRIWILRNENGESWSNTDQAMRDIGERLQSYRQSLHIVRERKIFGLPVMEFRDGRTTQVPLNGAGRRLKRLASPLHLRLSEIQTAQGPRYVGIATLFKTRWEDMNDTEFRLYELVEQKFRKELEVQI